MMYFYQALIYPFTEEEIRAAVFIMNPDKAPGPDGFSMSFYPQGQDDEDLMDDPVDEEE